MAYYTGTANDMAALRQALINACTLPAEGWAWDGANEVLSKGAMFLRLQIVNGYLALLGRVSATAGDAPNIVRIGTLGSVPVSFPMTYEIFAFAGEVYMVVNYGVSYYQWCAFGLSTVQGMPGTGMWFGASGGAQTNGGSPIYIGPTDGGENGNKCTSAALFWGSNAASSNSGRNCWLMSDIDSQGWWLSQTEAGEPVGVRALAPLVAILPSQWNSEAVLLPIRAYKVRPSNRVSITADLEHARYTRLDNYDPGQIISIGEDRWKIFPWYLRNQAVRNGGQNIGHTGTLGWAIRYEGT